MTLDLFVPGHVTRGMLVVSRQTTKQFILLTHSGKHHLSNLYGLGGLKSNSTVFYCLNCLDPFNLFFYIYIVKSDGWIVLNFSKGIDKNKMGILLKILERRIGIIYNKK